MIEFTLVIVLAAHLLCVNVAAAGPVVCLWLEWREGRGHELAGRVGRTLATTSLLLLLLGAVLGVVAGWLLWTPAFREAVHRLNHKLVWGGWEFLFSVVLLGVYVAWWRAAGISGKRTSGKWRLARCAVSFLAATNLLYHFPVLLVILARVATSTGSEPVSLAEFRRLMVDGPVISRVLHFLLASVAVAGVAVVEQARRMSRNGEPSPDVARVAAWGARIALVPTLLQVPVGIWVFAQLGPDAQQRLMGADVIAASLFALSVVGSLWLMHLLSAVAAGETSANTRMRVILVTIVLVVLMTGVLQRIRPAKTDGTNVGGERPARRPPSATMFQVDAREAFE